MRRVEVNLNNFEKRTMKTIIIAFIFFLLINALHKFAISTHTFDNYLLLHTILCFFGIFVSFSIFIHGWNTFSRYRSSTRLLISLLFLQVGIYDLFHALIYQEMPFFQNEFTVTKATSFWLLARLTDSLGLAYVFLRKKDRELNETEKYDYFAIALLISLGATALILFYPQIIPQLVDGNGVTPIKMAIEYIICIFYIVAMVAILKEYRKEKSHDLLTVFTGLVFLLLGELIFTIYIQVNSWDNLFGHVYNVVGFFFLMKGLYFPQVERVFYDRDVAQHKWKEAEQKLKENKQKMTKAIISAQEEERARVSRDLHDGIGQIFYSIAVKTQMTKRLSKRSEVVQQLEEIESIANYGMSEVKELATQLRPSVLDDLGLIPALRSYCKEYEKFYKINLTLETNNIQNITTPEIDIALYRICQEALTNIAKYAKANNIFISLKLINNKIVYVIKDDGIGFDVKSLSHDGIGLFSMQERAELIGGRFSVKSNLNKGTTISVEIPL